MLANVLETMLLRGNKIKQGAALYKGNLLISGYNLSALYVIYMFDETFFIPQLIMIDIFCIKLSRFLCWSSSRNKVIVWKYIFWKTV